MTENLFAYGTLMEPQIITDIIGRTPASEPAELNDYRRQCIQGELYPGIQPAPGVTTPGRIYFALTPPEMEKLDRFEGEMYHNTPVTLRSPSGDELSARAYVIRPEYRHLLLDEEWDYDAFRERFVERFTNEYRGFE
jgi:gamma-glutamylcyclotransferase (GGCT)/AIG2-like uncharacterized protein YtfP